MLYSRVLELSQDCIVKTCSVMYVKQWIGLERKVEVVSSICCWCIETTGRFILQLNH